MSNATHHISYKYVGYNTFFTWANAGYNYGSLSETHSYGTMAQLKYAFIEKKLSTF